MVREFSHLFSMKRRRVEEPKEEDLERDGGHRTTSSEERNLQKDVKQEVDEEVAELMKSEPAFSVAEQGGYNPRTPKRAESQDDGNGRVSTLIKAETEEVSEEPAWSIAPRENSPVDGLCDPIAWARQHFFDENYNPLSREVCERNAEEFIESQQKWDVQPILQLAARCAEESEVSFQLAMGVASLTCMVNSLLDKVRETDTPKPSFFDRATLILRKSFSLGCCEEVLIQLPSGNYFTLIDCLKPSEVSSCSSNNFFEHSKSIVRFILGKIAFLDPYFVAYSTSSHARAYVSLDSSFMINITEFLIAGFRQEHTAALECSLLKVVTECINNFVDRIRKVHNETCTQSAAQLAERLKRLISSSNGQVRGKRLDFSEITKNDLRNFLRQY